MTEEQVYEVKRAYDTGYVKGYQLAEKKYKEVIDKAIDYINGILTEAYLDESADIDIGLIEYAVDILKEVG